MAPSPRQASPELQQVMDECREKINKTLEKMLTKGDWAEAPLWDAMRYGVLNGGKRLRPFLVMQGAKIFGVDEYRARRVGVAVELLHSYSLIHDDLPAMDDADTRRGKPSVHKEYDEATAILAGDALLTLAFEVLATPETHEDPRVRIELVSELAGAAGGHGMVGGQMLDLLGEQEEFDIGTISRLQRLKTGKLIAFCCEAGAILGKANPAHRQALRNYAHDLGMAFQMTDDLLDITGNPEEMGKDAGKDEDAGKATFVSAMGVEAAQSRAQMLCQQAKSHLKIFDYGRADMLHHVADYVLQRRV
ncbi:MAG: polyprenyl synthetase family protein [Pseudomonadota bacterium]|nr:polyprenyl synthetase family protein [Pseudomonadota bacterium]QKK04286.1 MAG: polyprenyl synthetase family protein [Pseudomonadota bacterium]